MQGKKLVDGSMGTCTHLNTSYIKPPQPSYYNNSILERVDNGSMTYSWYMLYMKQLNENILNNARYHMSSPDTLMGGV